MNKVHERKRTEKHKRFILQRFLLSIHSKIRFSRFLVSIFLSSKARESHYIKLRISKEQKFNNNLQF